MKKTGKRATIQQIGSWILAFFILAYLFWQIDFDLFKASIQLAEMKLYLPLTILFVFIWFFIESQNIVAVCKQFGHPLSYKESLDIRGVTYLLMIINPFLGIGGIAYYLKKDIGIPLIRASSIMIFYSYSEMMSLLFIVTFGSIIIFNQSEMFSYIFYLCGGLFLLYNFLLICCRLLPSKGIIKKIKDVQVWKTFFEARPVAFILVPFWRGLYFITFIIFFYLGLKAFYIDIPFLHLVVYVPFIFGIGGLPITPFGLGTIQAAMIFFFKEYSTEANIMAFSVSYSTFLLVFRAPIGMYYLRKYNRRLQQDIE